MKRLVFVLAAVALLAAVYHFARDNHRAFADAPSGQFTISADAQSVLDNQTGLRWERNVTASSMKLTWTSALTRCNTLSLGGFTGWRLPTFKELETLVDEHQNNTALAAIDATAFPGTPGANGEGAFWSSTPMTKFAQRDESLTVNFLDGFGDFAPTSSTQFVRCVR